MTCRKEIHENSIMGSSHVSATSNVFEIAGRKPDEFEILQVYSSNTFVAMADLLIE